MPGNGPEHLCSPLIGRNSVTWPHSPAGASGKCSLAECPGKKVDIGADGLQQSELHSISNTGGGGEASSPEPFTVSGDAVPNTRHITE